MASLASESESESESCINIISVDGYSIDEIVQHIVDARRDRTESILSLHWPADAPGDLCGRIDKKLVKLDQIKIRRFEYDYQSGIAYIDIMTETSLHFQMLVGTSNYAELSLARFVATIPDDALRQRIVGEILNFGTASIEKKAKILKQGDFAFSSVKNKLPSLYIKCAEGDIQAAIVLDVQYRKANRAKVALCVADGTAAGTWVRYFDTIYDEKLVEQPEGEVGLYLSDFIGPTNLPVSFCRPSAAETAAGIQRNPQVRLTYEQLRKIFLKARAIYQGRYEPRNGEEEEEDNIYTIIQSAKRERERERERSKQELEQERERFKQELEQERERSKQELEQERERSKQALEQERELKQRIAMLQAQVLQLQRQV
ncbi:hypothetical protein B0J18DRAFT_470263 [Chaetomium sp. MPI-SDFR-AT-0129]|nr:hypothetical protein B0J18DRAFT_470263 [Chaetomium sp. MPI-SDFR-AT-0129]